MLTISGDRQSFCDGVSRRNFLKVGALGMGGLGLPELLRLRAEAAPSHTAPKAVILVCLPGGPSHLDMYDMKPDAPAEYRGEFDPVQTNVPGLDICVLMPLQTKIADLYQRGLDHDVAVVIWGEFGRTPRINFAAGRDHWPRAGFALFTGGGFRTGQVIGMTDARGERPVNKGYTPQNVFATLYHSLGIDPDLSTYRHPSGRPLHLLDDCNRIAELG